MVVFYVSGHGFGHAVRQIEIINRLTALDPSIPLTIRTSAPRWLFERSVRGAYTFQEAEVDTGVVQHDSLTLDEAGTIRRAAAFYETLDRRAAEDAALLRRLGARFVVADAPPLACAAAALAGIPSAVCANFTWDWIYAGYAGHVGLAPALLPTVRDAYARASCGWRLPMHGGFETVPRVADVPFVARRPRADQTPREVRRALGLPLDRPLALVSFGGYGVDALPLDRLDCAPAWGVVVTAAGEARSEAGLLTIAESSIYAAGLRYEDLVRAVDVVVTKPGYGIIADCLAGGTAMLYTSRGRFAEYDVLVADMPRYLRCRFIDPGDLRAGRWRAALDALLASPPPPEIPSLAGAEVIASLIAGSCQRPASS